MSTVQPVPEGFHTVTPYLIVPDGSGAIDFYKRAFNAAVLSQHANPDGRLVHALLRIGDSFLMMGEHNALEDVDALSAQAVAAGAKEIMPVQDQYYGDRSGGVEDPFGIVWWIATHKEDMSDEELMRRAAQRGTAH